MARNTDSIDEADRVLALVRDLVEDSDLGRGEIERRAGLSRGYLARILSGRVDLKLWQLIGLLEALDRNPAEFFASAFPRPRPPSARRDPRTVADLTVNKDIVRVYSMGIESVRELRTRLERCERALAELRESGWLDEILKRSESGD